MEGQNIENTTLKDLGSNNKMKTANTGKILFDGNAFNLRQHSPEVAILTFDLKGERVNKFDGNVFEDLENCLEIIEKSSKLKALLIRSAKQNSFIVGADINLIQSMKDKEEATAAAAGGQKIFNRLEDLSVKTLVAIEGPCMGGGTEFSLACDYRVCSDHAKTVIAVPEVKLGILPGWGGTYRLPKTVGLMNALEMITSGKNIRAKKAPKIGLADLLVPHENFENLSIQLAEELAKTGTLKGKKSRKVPFAEKLLTSNPIGRSVFYSKAKKMILKQSKGHYPSPLKSLELLKKHSGKNRDAYLEQEAKAFGELWATEESKNLVRLFFLMEDNKKNLGDVKLTKDEIKKIEKIEQLSVLGAGTMGGGIAYSSSKAGLFVLLKDIAMEAVGKGLAHAQKLISKEASRRRINKTEAGNRMARIKGQIDYVGFKGSDLVVEAVVENLEIKKKVFSELEKHVREDCVLASNTSTLRLNDIASSLKNPERFLGVHFFNPVDKMPLVEVVRGEKTKDECIVKAVNYCKAMGKTPVVVNDAPGFLVNRLLVLWLTEGGHAMKDGLQIEEIDRTMRKWGMPLGVFELLDTVGLDVCSIIGHTMHAALGERYKPSNGLDKFMEANKTRQGTKRLGQKSGLGFYQWDGRKRGSVDTDGVYKDIGIQPGSKSLSGDEIIKRFFYQMVNEATLLLKEGVSTGPDQIDLAMIFGTGFPPFRGGLCRWADSVGLKNIVADLEKMEKESGLRFKPHKELVELANSKGRFYD